LSQVKEIRVSKNGSLDGSAALMFPMFIFRWLSSGKALLSTPPLLSLASQILACRKFGPFSEHFLAGNSRVARKDGEGFAWIRMVAKGDCPDCTAGTGSGLEAAFERQPTSLRTI
jgi:hypothetical protein